MTGSSQHDAWQAGDSYDLYMGRWSRQVAPIFLDWLDAPEGSSWLDVGCGTGALSASILARCKPKSLISVDPSDGFLDKSGTMFPMSELSFAWDTPNPCRSKRPAGTWSCRGSF